MPETKHGALAPPSDLVARIAPEAAADFEHLETLAFEVADPVLLELVRLRMAHLLGDEGGSARRSDAAIARGLSEQKIAELARWPTSDLFSPTERACLGLAEQYVIDVSSVSEADTEPVLELLGAPGLYGFVQALWVIDESIRLDLALGAAFLHEGADNAEARS
jgi:alkylhydroperoxidase family enzyme